MTAIATLLFWLMALTPVSGQTIRAAEVAIAIVRHFEPEARSTMLCIGYWETRQEPYSNDLVGAAGEIGVFQILPWVHLDLIYSLGYTVEDLFRLEVNVEVASELWKQSRFRPWTTYQFCRGQ